MKLLITGATGFVGLNALDLLMQEEAGIEVHAIARNLGTAPTHLDFVQWHEVDFLASDATADAMHDIRPSHLLNLAWVGSEHREDRYESDMNVHWAEASERVFRQFTEAGGQRIVNAGSCLEYGGTQTPWNEAATTLPSTAYGRGKLAVTESCLRMQIPAASARIFFTYGPYEDPRRLVAGVARSLLREEPIALTSGTQRRDYIHIQDVATALLLLLKSESSGVFNVGTGESVAVATIARKLAALLGREDLLQFGARPAGGDADDDMTAALPTRTNELGWHPSFTLAEGLSSTLKWWMEELASPSSVQDQLDDDDRQP